MLRKVGKRFIVSCFLLVILMGARMLRAQTVSIASVSGRVVDQQEAVVSGAHVKLTSVDTGVVHDTTTNDDGIYHFPSVQIGAYTLESSASGFRTYVQTGIVLRVNDNVLINVTLAIGDVTQRVEVQANATMVQTQQNTISQVIDQQRVIDLPLNGRNPTQLILISGASVTQTAGTNTGSKSFFSSQAISVAGGQGNGTNYLLDGGDNNDTYTNVNMPLPFPDALQEFSVETSALPARNGIHPGGMVNVVTKSGSNQWHGNLFEFVRNTDVNAWNYFSFKQDGLKRNQFGGTLGGRIIPNKLFFFGGFQQSNIRQAPNSSSAFVPTAAALKGDFSALDGAGCQANHTTRSIKNPTTGAVLANGQIDPTLFDKAAVALANYLPPASNDCGQVTWGVPVHSNESQYIGRVDWTVNNKHAFYARYFLDSYTLAANFDPKDILVTAVTGNVERAQSFVLGDTYALSGTIFNSFHGTFERRRDDRFPANGINLSTLGATNVYQYTKNYLQLSVTNGGFNIGCGTCALGHWNNNTFQYADDVDWQHGKHQLAFGADIIRTQLNQLNNYYDNGVFTFNGQYSNDPLLDFLMGTVSSLQQSTPQTIAMRQTILGFYGQDTFHVTPKLVVNFGLRWEPMLFPQDYFHRGDIFSRAAFDAGQTSTVFTNAPPGMLFHGDTGVTNSFANDKVANFSPRLGIVYNPDGNGKTTFRLGGALLYDSASPFTAYRNATNPPFAPTINPGVAPYQLSNPWAKVAGGNPFPLAAPSSTVTFPTAAVLAFIPAHIQTTNVMTWNASVQHQLSQDWFFSVSYLGNKTSHLWLGQEINPGVFIPGNCGSAACSTTGNTQARRVLSLANSGYGKYYGVMVLEDDGNNANYNALLASIEHRFSHNYTFLANYTWSKCLDYGDNTGPLNQEGQFEQPYNNAKADYGPCGIDERNIVNVSLVAKSEFGHAGLASHILSDWQIAPLFRYSTGMPVNPLSGLDNSRTGIGNDRPNVASSTAYTGAGHTAKLYQFLNPVLYAQNAVGTFGNASKNSLVAPAYTDVDAALSRQFGLHERFNLNTRVEAFNIFNHPNFSAPNASVSSSSFGKITTANDPRILQGAIQLIF